MKAKSFEDASAECAGKFGFCLKDDCPTKKN